MSQMIYKTVIDKLSKPFIYGKAILNDKKEVIDWVFIDANKAFEKNFKIKLIDVIDKKASSIIPNDSSDYKRIIRFINHSLKHNRNRELDYYSSLLKRFFHLNIIVENNERFVLLINPISKMLKQANHYEEQYNKIINNMVEHIWILDLNYNFSYLIPSFKQGFGLKFDDFFHLQDVFTPKSFKKAKEYMEYILAEYKKGTVESNQTFKFIAEEERPTGKNAYVEHAFQILIDDDNVPYAFIGLGRDITDQQRDKEMLYKSEEMLRLILNTAAEGIFGFDQSGICTFINQSGLRLLGYQKPEDLVGKKIQNLICNCESNCPLEEVLITGDKLYSEHTNFLRADNTYLDIELFAFPQVQDDVVTGIVVTFFDITNRLKVQKELKESERSKSVLLSNLPGMAYRCKFDPKWTMEFVSDGCYELTGYRKEALLYNKELSFNDIIKHEYRQALWNKWVEITNSYEMFRDEYIIITADGTEKWVLEQGQAVHDDEGNIVALEGMITDITDIKKKQEKIEFLLYYDSLTNLYNRRYFEKAKKELDTEINYPLTIMYSDINGLKLINDAFGHNVGDDLIVATAQTIKTICREDDVLARIGGDEFALLLPRTDEDEAYELMIMILKRLDEANKIFSNEKYHISLSMGFGTKITSHDDLLMIQKQAEDFMYRRKLLERNSFHNSLIKSIQTTMYEKSQETEQHAERLMNLSLKIGLRLSLTQAELDQLELLSALHDIGKISVPETILKKPDKLTLDEWEEIKKHPVTGYRIAMAIPELNNIADLILCHHERWDGKGYPQGLVGEEIPFLSRVLSVLDAYDAMTEYRSYRKPLTPQEALIEIRENAGSQFDPRVASEFLEMMEEYLTKWVA